MEQVISALNLGLSFCKVGVLSTTWQWLDKTQKQHLALNSAQCPPLSIITVVIIYWAIFVMDRIMFPQRCPHLSPQSLWICSLHSQKDFAVGMKDLEMERWSWWTGCNHRDPYTKEAGDQSKKERWPWRQRKRLKVLCCGLWIWRKESWTRGHRQHLEAGRDKGMGSHWEKEHSPTNPF